VRAAVSLVASTVVPMRASVAVSMAMVRFAERSPMVAIPVPAVRVRVFGTAAAISAARAGSSSAASMAPVAMSVR